MHRRWCKNMQASARSENTMLESLPQELMNLTARCKKCKKFAASTKRVVGSCPCCLFKELITDYIFQNKSLPKGRDIMLSFFMGNI